MDEEQDHIIIEVDDSEFDAQKEAKDAVRVLSFRLGTEHYCIHITDAKEVFKPASITRIPNTPAFIVGITNLHGAAIPLIDIRYFLGLHQKEGLAGTKVIVTDVGHNIIGIMVDDVDEALDIEEASIQPPLATIKGKLADFTKGQVQLGPEIVVLLELKKILNCEEIENLKKG
ncbi:MAG: chemotaxis protein CheW [Candidatus Omnitrophica bacterium]|nr:chemotaxis protein CheW [Candidatus Omnitrophota bacterium]